MNRLHSMILRVTAVMLCLALLVSSAGSAESGPPARSARDLAASLAPLQDGVSYVRLRLEVKRPDDKGRFIPGDLAVRGRQDDSVTDLQGSRIKHDVAFQRLTFASGRIACFGKLTRTTAIYIGPRTGRLGSNMKGWPDLARSRLRSSHPQKLAT